MCFPNGTMANLDTVDTVGININTCIYIYIFIRKVHIHINGQEVVCIYI